MDKLQLTPRCYQSLTLAKKYAQRFKSKFVTSDHMFLGIIDLDNSTAFAALKNSGVDVEAVKKEMYSLLEDNISNTSKPIKLSDIGFSPKTPFPFMNLVL